MLALEKQKLAIDELNIDIVGHLFWYSIPSKALWRRSEFETAMTQSDVPIEISPSLSNRSDFIRALRTMQEGRLVRPVSETKEELVFQATKELKDSIGLTYEREAVISFDKISKTVEATDAAFAAAVRSRIGTESDIYRGDDLRRVVGRILSKEANAIKPRSGVCFVPYAKRFWLNVLQAFLGRLNIDEIGAYPLADLECVRQQISKVYSIQAKKAIDELQNEIAGLKDSGAPAGVLTRRFKKISEIRDKCCLYSDALQLQADEVARKIKSVECLLRSSLLGV